MHNHAFARARLLLPATVPLIVGAWLLAGCGSDVKPAKPRTTSSTTTGSVIFIGTGAPAAGILSFATVIQSIEAIDAAGQSISLIRGTPIVDFARYNDWQTVLDTNEVPADTYTQIAVTFGKATIGFLPTQSGSALPSRTMPAVFSASTVTVALPAPLVVTQTGPVSIRVDFHLDKSIQINSSGNSTGEVNPVLDIRSVAPGDSGQPVTLIHKFDDMNQ